MADGQDLLLVQQLIEEALPTLSIQTEGGVYPYELRDSQPPEATFSMSTNSMVAHALAVLAGLLPDSAIAVCHGQREAGLPNYQGHLTRAIDRLVEGIVEDGAEDPYDSTTFGQQDPMTLGWLIELFAVADQLSDEPRLEPARVHLREVAARRVRDAVGSIGDPAKPVFRFSADGRDKSNAVEHPLPLLRIVQLARMLQIDLGARNTELYDHFHRQLQLQVSRQGIEYSEFDIAELVLCLEGMLTADPTKVTQPVVDRVGASVNEVHRTNPTLRPITPFKTSRQGAVHLFSSVEVFVSLLRIATILEQQGRGEFFVQLKPALRDYLYWLQSAKVNGRATLPDVQAPKNRLRPGDLKFMGWHSEYAHTNAHVVHVWLTSLVLVFLHGYGMLLSRQIARDALSGTELVPESISGVRTGESRPAVVATSDGSGDAAALDPVQSVAAESVYRVASRLYDGFVAPRLAGGTDWALYSCLLYGPPGTGKTTIARWLAKQLGWPLLTITTSDFIIDGEARVEARAKQVFEALAKQRDLVVFFDEIDRLVLDRDLSTYANQGDMLQFMTPSMLTKLNNLRAAQQVVVIIGTNYADRIDKAIKRTGRIDQRLLVLPPDLIRRESIIREETAKLPERDRPGEAAVTEAARIGVGRTIAELNAAVRRFAMVGGDLVEHVRSFIPQLSLFGYRSRIRTFVSDSGDLSECPPELLEEAFLVAYLLAEGTDNPRSGQSPLADHDWLWPYWTMVGDDVVRDPVVRDRLQALAAAQGPGRG